MVIGTLPHRPSTSLNALVGESCRQLNGCTTQPAHLMLFLLRRDIIPRVIMTINFDEFIKVEIRVGTIVAAEPFPEARRPALKLTIDFGSKLGLKRSSAQ